MVAGWLLFTESGYEVQKYVSPVAVKVDVHLFGSDQQGIGINTSIGIPKLSPVSYRWHWGATYYTKYYGNTDFSGWETRKGQEYSLMGLYSASYTDFTMHNFDGFKHSNTRLTWGGPFINASYENDYTHKDKFKFFRKITPKSIKMGDDMGDRWRTNAVRINLGPVKVGLNMITGDPGPYGNREWYIDENGNKVYRAHGDYDPNQYRAGILYFGIGPLRIGRNTEGIRNTFQNEFAHKPEGIPYFEVLPIEDQWYWYWGTGTGGTNW